MAARGMMPTLRGRPSIIQTGRGGGANRGGSGSAKTTPTKMGNGRGGGGGGLTARGAANSRLMTSSRGRGGATTSALLNMARGGDNHN